MTGGWPDRPEAPDRLIDWTGERCVPWSEEYQVIYEHYHRYSFARQFVEGRTVVDLASGEGYGAQLMAEVASLVVGVDIDEQSVRHARSTYQHPRLEFRTGSMLDLEVFGNQRFERVVCFEALEHVSEQAELFQVVKSILEPGGMLLISTPDTEVYSGELHNENPFHVHELTRPEFSALLSSHFDHVTLLGQATVVGSSIRKDWRKPTQTEVRELRRNEEGWDVTPVTTRPAYLLAVASDQELPRLHASLLIDPEMRVARDPTRRLSQLNNAYAQLESERENLAGENEQERARRRLLERRIEELEGQVESVKGHAEEIAAVLADTEERVQSTERQLASRNEELAIYEDAASVQMVRKLAGYIDRVLPRHTEARSVLARVARRVLGMREH